jgi:homoserine O-succinyltransferase
LIVVPKDYHIKNELEEANIQCITQSEALKEDIRALRIGILNIMPQAESYEYSLLQPLGQSVIQIEPVWIRLKTHTYTSSDKQHLDAVYVTFEKAIEKLYLDGLLLTGAPVEEIPFAQVTYWDEIVRILTYARRNVASTLGICWGGLALAKFLGIEKEVYDKKIFGVFETRNLKRKHRITGNMDDVFFCPHSSHSKIPDATMETAAEKGLINLLAHAEIAGYTIFESTDRRFLMHLGHPEYEPERLVYEYTRDRQKGRTDVEPPANLDLEYPLNRWRGHRTELFNQWIKYIHETTRY